MSEFLASLGELGLTPEVGKTIKLMISPSPDVSATAGFIESNGKVWFHGAWAAANRLGLPDAGEAYLEAIASIIGGQIRRYEKSAPEVVDQAGHGCDAASLLADRDGWKQAIASLRRALADL